MIKAAILDADTRNGGELIRILMHHPDVEIISVQSEDRDGERVSNHHYGLIGDTDLCYQSGLVSEDADVVFLCKETADLAQFGPETRIVDLTGTLVGTQGFVMGICELNRKAMVRGAQRASVVSPAVQASVIALLPLARQGELHGRIEVDAQLSSCGLEQIKEAVISLQPDFDGEIVAGRGKNHGFTSQVTVRTDRGVGDMRTLYSEAFSDHNFTFVIDRDPEMPDVLNTNKCLLSIDGGNNVVTVKALMDPYIKGCAGNAVHCMNLLFGLHEVTGLRLKALGR
ncbi:MAG: hypothetical protein Q4F07_04060 [Bacteroidales bacterium]|nr:hypothetical protein [Bacteroidales bacterium]